MAFDWTLIKTDSLAENNDRQYWGYNLSGGAGMVLNVRLRMAIPGALASLSPTKGMEKEVYLPGDNTSSLNPTWTQLKDEDLGNRLHRYEHAYQTPGGNVLLRMLTTAQMYISGKLRTFYVDESYTVIQNATISGTDIVGGGNLSVVPWFKWNDTDLTQFDSVVQGGGVTAHVAQVVSYGGVNWIDLRVTANGAGGTGNNNGIVLPISATPPSADYVIAYDFISRETVSNVVGAGAMVRFVSITQAYYCRYSSRTTIPIQDFGKCIAGPALQRFEDMDDPRLGGIDRGVRMALSVQGTGAGAIAKMIVGEPTLYLDTSPYDAVGKAALFQTTGGVVGSTRNYFRNIRCYRANQVEEFEL
jgi:hypothetical protein